MGRFRREGGLCEASTPFHSPFSCPSLTLPHSPPPEGAKRSDRWRNEHGQSGEGSMLYGQTPVYQRHGGSTHYERTNVCSRTGAEHATYRSHAAEPATCGRPGAGRRRLQGRQARPPGRRGGPQTGCGGRGAPPPRRSRPRPPAGRLGGQGREYNMI
jgi:hypothetical protein